MGVVKMQTLSEHVALMGVDLGQLPTTPECGTSGKEKKGSRYIYDWVSSNIPCNACRPCVHRKGFISQDEKEEQFGWQRF